jgi:hypothetical protein
LTETDFGLSLACHRLAEIATFAHELPTNIARYDTTSYNVTHEIGRLNQEIQRLITRGLPSSLTFGEFVRKIPFFLLSCQIDIIEQ